MKKIISKLALVGIAVAALCTSCVVEDIQTSFDIDDAVCTVNVQVLYALDQSDVTSKASISCKYGTGSVINVPASNKKIAAEDLVITATLGDASGSTTVTIGALLPGGKAEYKALIVLGSLDDIRYECESVCQEYESEIGYLHNSHYSHADGEEGWLYNDTEFILNGTATDYVWTGGHVTDCDSDDPQVLAFSKALDELEPLQIQEDSFEFSVSAWAAYQVTNVVSKTIETFSVYEINDATGTEELIGNITYEYYSGWVWSFEEKANPSHAAHYHYGHGHDGHGAYDNAGGGIVYGE